MITGTIQSLAFGGYGVLKYQGLVLFVPFTAPQDEVTVEITTQKKNHGFARLVSLDTPSPDRTTPPCPYYGTCGGCQLQHITYPAQLEAKRRFIEDALHRIAKLPVPIPPIIPAPHQWNYRCHITLRLNPHNNTFQAGYTTFDNYRFLPVTTCPIFSSDDILTTVQDLVSKLDSTGVEEASLRIFKAERNYILSFTFSKLPSNIALCEHLPPHIQAIFASPKHIFGTPHCTTTSLGITANYSPYGFLQNFPEQRDAIYRAILANTPTPAAKILDLYCGIGLTSLLFAAQGKTVIGIESNPDSIAIAKQNNAHNKLTAQFHLKKVEELGPSVLKTFQPDSVLCNPPREGIDPILLSALAQHPPKHLQYLSCMPSTLARDLKALTAAGYTIEAIQGFDMFPQTTHVETLVSLTKN